MCPPIPFSLSASFVEIGTIYEGKRHVPKECGNCVASLLFTFLKFVASVMVHVPGT